MVRLRSFPLRSQTQACNHARALKGRPSWIRHLRFLDFSRTLKSFKDDQKVITKQAIKEDANDLKL